MDFAVPDFIRDALYARLDTQLSATPNRRPPLEAFQGWLQYHYQWSIPEVGDMASGIVQGMNMAARCLGLEEKVRFPRLSTTHF